MEEQKKRVYDALDKLKIKYEVVEHEPVHTMEDMDRLGLPEKGTLCKNLFLRDSKGKRHFLVTCDEKTEVNLKDLGKRLGAGNISFAASAITSKMVAYSRNTNHAEPMRNRLCVIVGFTSALRSANEANSESAAMIKSNAIATRSHKGCVATSCHNLAKR